LFNGGSKDDQRGRYIPKCSKGDFLLGFALTEPDSGSDAFAMKTRAVLDGDDYVINGNKCFISNSGLTDLYIMFATIDPALRRGGVTAFMVEKDTPGLTIAKHENKMGWRASPTCQLNFTDMRVPKKNVLGKVGKGWGLVLQSLTETRILVASVALGLAQGAMEAAVAYSTERQQFARPINAFQGISFMLADMALKIEPARALIYQVAHEIDNGNREQVYLACIAKCFASDTAMQVTTDAVQVLGGYGYTKDYPVEKMMRDAKACQIVEGSNQIQRIQIARNLIKMFG
jgi:alkylation response protein AidB-like acyl-CoA dehydrogenase